MRTSPRQWTEKRPMRNQPFRSPPRHRRRWRGRKSAIVAGGEVVVVLEEANLLDPIHPPMAPETETMPWNHQPPLQPQRRRTKNLRRNSRKNPRLRDRGPVSSPGEAVRRSRTMDKPRPERRRDRPSKIAVGDLPKESGRIRQRLRPLLTNTITSRPPPKPRPKANKRLVPPTALMAKTTPTTTTIPPTPLPDPPPPPPLPPTIPTPRPNPECYPTNAHPKPPSSSAISPMPRKNPKSDPSSNPTESTPETAFSASPSMPIADSVSSISTDPQRSMPLWRRRKGVW
mmetsp:Transcript_20277/g.42548  ORF Transcript_20277/g.42548 Transcript_20277/m.42548 type:complete len:286 (+) Transcript_20277:157-1014(+)